MPVDSKWFRDRIADNRMSQRSLARQLGLDAAAVSLMLRGKREMKIAEAAAIARLLGVPADDVMQAAGVRTSSKGTMIPLAGWIDGSSEIHLDMTTDGSVPHPGGDLPEDACAFECKTAGTDLEHMDGWILFTGRLAKSGGIVPEAVGHLSFCRIKSGVLYLAKITRGRQRGRWTLTGPGGTIANAEVEWARPVIIVCP